MNTHGFTTCVQYIQSIEKHEKISVLQEHNRHILKPQGGNLIIVFFFFTDNNQITKKILDK